MVRILHAAAWAFALTAAVRADPPAEFFEKQVRPVLAEHCFSCHGSMKQKAGLRLDSRAAILKGGENGPVALPGEPSKSRLIEVLRFDGETKMPPKGKLPQAAIEALAGWVKMGMPWPNDGAPVADPRRHWAFQKVLAPPLPEVKNREWPRDPLDRFILARMEEKGVAPASAADRRAWIRRVTLDLIGLPPTPAEIDQFLADTGADPEMRVVDRLLASPRFGERWARHWLDVARFSDTKGYVFFQDAQFPWAYTFRDYVIGAFNADLPYDRFLIEQLAADQVPGADLRALGFLSLGGRFMNNIHDILDDRIDVVSRGLWGLTITCARCHDHKFDPISMADYYGLYGVFASSVEPEVPPLFTTPPETRAYLAFKKELETREKKLADFIRAQYDQVIAGSKSRVAEYWLAVRAQGDQPVHDDFMLIADGGDLHPKILKRWRAQLDRAKRKHDPVLSPWLALAAIPDAEFAARAAALTRSWVAQPDSNRPIHPQVLVTLAARPPTSAAEAAKRCADLLNDVERLWETAGKPERFPDPMLDQLRQVFHGPGAAPNLPTTQIDDLELFPDRPSQAKLQEFRKAVEQWRISGAGAPPRAHALVDIAIPVEPRIFRRGNPNQPGDAAPRRMPSVLGRPEPFRTGSGRLEMARATVTPEHPLTARVMVNRVWVQLFGAGLVRTPSDFGLRSDPPTHPELLDHLADGFVADGWSMKRLIRRMVLSATYRQSSMSRPELATLDPENRLLARMNRRRLDFEATRDSLLAVAGRLDSQLGGPSVRDFLNPGSSRRTLYGYVDRLQVPGLLRNFDYPSPDASSAQRDVTTVPQQALFLMNSPLAVEAARALSRRPETATTAGDDRVRRTYAILFGRAPSDDELLLARAFTTDRTATAWERYFHALLATNEFVFID